jgi:site-specific DNA-methyltransferase (adenine-specific)
MPTPFFQQVGITIYHGDALDVLRHLPSGSVDAVITDPPYGTQPKSGGYGRKNQRILNDTQPFIWFLWDAFRIVKEGGCLVCSCRWDVEDVWKMAIEAAGFQVRSQVVWDRVVHGMGDLSASFAPQHDVIWFATKGRFAFPNGRPKSVLRHQRAASKALLHPTEKPVGLMVDLLRATVPPGGIVVDPFMGSGTTLVAAEQLGLKAIGIELGERYCEIAVERLPSAAGAAA